MAYYTGSGIKIESRKDWENAHKRVVIENSGGEKYVTNLQFALKEKSEGRAKILGTDPATFVEKL